MTKKYKVITLCGSTKFKDDFIRVQKELTLQGNIVISVGLFGHSGDDEVWSDDTKEMLDNMHKEKIDMADEIFVINKDGYIGNSTKSEIAYALATDKIVRFMERPNKELKDSIAKIESIILDGGKYEIIIIDNGREFKALINGEEWRNLLGDNLILAMFYKIQGLEEKIKKLQSEKNQFFEIKSNPNDLVARFERYHYIKTYKSKARKIKKEKNAQNAVAPDGTITMMIKEV